MDTFINFTMSFYSRLFEVTIPLIAAVVAWFMNERRKRAWEEYQRKEENYKALLRTSRGFYENAQDTAKKATFLEQVDLCWLYCTDDVIKKAYAFLETVKTGATTNEADRQHAFGELMVAVRQDMLKRKVARTSSLTPGDYHLFKAN